MGVEQHTMMNDTGIMECGWFGCDPSGVVERVDAGANSTCCDPFGVGEPSGVISAMIGDPAGVVGCAKGSVANVCDPFRVVDHADGTDINVCGPAGVVERLDAGANSTCWDPFGVGCASATAGDIAGAFRATVGSSTSCDKIPSKMTPKESQNVALSWGKMSYDPEGPACRRAGSQPVFRYPSISPTIP